MKRVLLAAVVAVAIVGLLVAPAFAAGPQLPVFRLDLKTAYVIAYADGTWFELIGDREAPDPIWHDPGDPIPANYDVVMQFSWKNVNYGLVKTFPNAFDLKVSIPEAGVEMSYEDAKQYWNATCRAYASQRSPRDVRWRSRDAPQTIIPACRAASISSPAAMSDPKNRKV